MVAECIIREDEDSLLGLSLANVTEGNLTITAGDCYQVCLDPTNGFPHVVTTYRYMVCDE